MGVILVQQAVLFAVLSKERDKRCAMAAEGVCIVTAANSGIGVTRRTVVLPCGVDIWTLISRSLTAVCLHRKGGSRWAAGTRAARNPGLQKHGPLPGGAANTQRPLCKGILQETLPPCGNKPKIVVPICLFTVCCSQQRRASATQPLSSQRWQAVAGAGRRRRSSPSGGCRALASARSWTWGATSPCAGLPAACAPRRAGAAGAR